MLAHEMTDTISEFAALAEQYCQWASGTPGTTAQDDAKACELLPKLYLAAHRLPEGAPSDADSGDHSHLEYQAIYDRFRSLSVGYYGDTSDPLVVPPEQADVGDVSDDLADIYGDLLRGLELFRAGAPAAAAWEWRYHFIIHWGTHLVGALRALHHSWAKASPPY